VDADRAGDDGGSSRVPALQPCLPANVPLRLPPGQQVSRHEARDVAQAARRMIRALVRRAGAGDTEALRELVETQRMIGEAIVDAGAAAYATGHYSYTDLAQELGITRQAARQRFASITRADRAAVVDEDQLTLD
jgi:hypothetical protein